jgi:riboflavin kinase/FMN adenylyltransferase
MQIHNGLGAKPLIKNAIVTSGTFDGVHLGHQHILKQLCQEAKKINGESVVITFWPHPRMILEPQNDIQLLSSLEEKLELFKKFDLDHVWVIPFDREFSLLSSSEFIQKIIIDTLKTSKLIIGYDHKFGKNREGSFEFLVENKSLFPFEIEEIQKQTVDDLAFSSTLARDFLVDGEIEKSTELLGYQYTITGTVTKGFQNGRLLGYPTANLEINFPNKLIPKDGVYAVKTERSNGQKYFSMLNIGNRPTLGTGKSIEVHLLNFDESIYGEKLKIEFFCRLRDEKRFESKEKLIEQLKLDEKNTRRYFDIDEKF